MMNWFAKLLLTSTAIAPVLLTYAWVGYFSSGNWLQACLLVSVCFILIVLCIGLMKQAKKYFEKVDFKITNIEVVDHENMAFLLLYLLPLFRTQFEIQDWKIWAPAIVIFGLAAATGYNYHFNPLLGFMKWHFYKVCTNEGVTYVLITKRQLRKVDETFKVVELTEYVVLDVEVE